MRLTRLVGENFRNFDSFSFSPTEKINVIYGENGSGKTSLLEAIYLFGFGRSFRPGGFRPLIKEGKQGFTLFTETLGERGQTRLDRFGLSRNLAGHQELRINGSNAPRLADLAMNVPVQLFTPESVEIIVGGPGIRRQAMDWGVFHVEPSFFPLWSNYNKVLRHRNKLLKNSKGRRAIDDQYWQRQLSGFGEQITQLRSDYVSELSKYLKQMTHSFLPDVTLDVSLKSGWDSSKTLEDALQGSLASDLRYGHTTVGPHKADLAISADGLPAKERLSRGQQKVVVASLKLAQAEFFKDRMQKSCIIIVDDLTSELDVINQKKFCHLLEASGNQVFITTVSLTELSDKFTKEPQVFHVEHGILKSHIEN
ncbi:DNA replication/repair protein RecF [Idiomarina seosinensis]|uniref:DNA replication and repair protein RecF n=1 Tax=Idiomarina seosinensis TaxID=281739 RepID=A0A432ZE90_9GAMM|nr:DNA replication/repair protein RecF [Idiomarina seosinensis]RUO76219.1 DNA replication/repair protein RecF [Idiomarina seosinensis]